jgi:VanZ family protein
VNHRDALPWLAALGAWAALIFILSSFPNPPGPRVTEPRAIAAHLVFYAILGYLAHQAWSRLRGANGPAVALAAWLFAVAYGISDEFHQSFVPNRDASTLDVLADALGAAGGVGAAWWRLRRHPRPLSRRADLPGPARSRRAQ